MEPLKQKLYLIWQAADNPRFTVCSDGEKFIAQIHAGPHFSGTVLAVGYSSINGACDEHHLYLGTPTATKPVEWGESQYGWDEPMDLEPIKKAIQRAYDKIEMKNLMEMMPALLSLAEAADQAFNELL